jgi:photosystem II stability/assembly factor-like uncharacterized protein
MVSEDEGWAAQDDGKILHYTNGTWQFVPSPTTQGIVDIDMAMPSEGWAVGAYGTILRYQGGEWQIADSPTDAGLMAVDMVSATEGWAMGDCGTILHYSAGSATSITDSNLAGGLRKLFIPALPGGGTWVR